MGPVQKCGALYSFCTIGRGGRADHWEGSLFVNSVLQIWCTCCVIYIEHRSESFCYEIFISRDLAQSRAISRNLAQSDTFLSGQAGLWAGLARTSHAQTSPDRGRLISDSRGRCPDQIRTRNQDGSSHNRQTPDIRCGRLPPTPGCNGASHHVRALRLARSLQHISHASAS